MTILIPQNTSVFQDSARPCLETAVKSAEYYDNTVHVVDYKAYAEQEEFGKIFQHSGPNPSAFEQWCFEQWFLIRDWMRENGADTIFKSESDVLVFEDLEKFPRHGGLLCSFPVATSFVSRQGAEFICNEIMAAFRNSSAAALCAPDHVADFILVGAVLDGQGQPNFIDTLPAICPNICLPLGAHMYQDHRDVFFQRGRPFSFVRNTTVQFATLHCWGRAKFAMPQIWGLSQSSLYTDLGVRLGY